MDTLVRAQVKPQAGTWTTLHTAEGELVVSTIRCCNVDNNTDRISVRRALLGAAESGEQYLCHEVAVPPSFPYSMTEGYTLLTDDVLWVWSERGSVAFSLSGEVKT